MNQPYDLKEYYEPVMTDVKVEIALSIIWDLEARESNEEIQKI